MEDKLQAIADLENQINADTELDAEVKTKVLSLIMEVKNDPSDANLEALAVVLDTLGDSESFKAVIAAVSALVAKSAEEEVMPPAPTL